MHKWHKQTLALPLGSNRLEPDYGARHLAASKVVLLDRRVFELVLIPLITLRSTSSQAAVYVQYVRRVVGCVRHPTKLWSKAVGVGNKGSEVIKTGKPGRVVGSKESKGTAKHSKERKRKECARPHKTTKTVMWRTKQILYIPVQYAVRASEPPLRAACDDKLTHKLTMPCGRRRDHDSPNNSNAISLRHVMYKVPMRAAGYKTIVWTTV